jgi:hypothetical protein
MLTAALTLITLALIIDMVVAHCRPSGATRLKPATLGMTGRKFDNEINRPFDKSRLITHQGRT